MRSSYICVLSDIDNDENLWGAKGVALRRISLEGMNVPATFIISSQYYRQYLEHKSCLNEFDVFLEILNDELRSWVSNLGLARRNLIFRSSANIEGGNLTCCGIFESYQTQKSQPFSNLVQAVWNSASSEVALRYLSLKNLELEKVNMAVIVQEYIFGDICGTIHTWDAIHNENQFIIEYEKARFEGVVDGDSNPCQITIDPKTAAIVNSVSCQIPLTEKQIKNLLALGLSVQNVFGFHVEIEFVMQGVNPYIIQARKLI